MSTSTEKRCYYEVLNLPQTCTQDEIRSSYKKLALQRHPDKLIQSGVAASDATSSFQELVHAYEVLSDPKERSWYDSHRSQILYSNISSDNHGGSSSSSSTGGGTIPDLFSYFSASCYSDYKDSETGFYRVYGDVFGRVYANEVNYCRRMGLGLGLVKEAPVMGDLGSDYGQVTAFYGYWLGFSTVMDFGWVSKWDVAGGRNRKERRLMEDENSKVIKKAKREFNETVRGLAEFVKKRDKRVIDMGVKKEKERERKREEEAKRRKEKEREKMERARKYEDPEWARVDDDDVAVGIDDVEEEDEEEEKREFYCAACGKKFKSDKQWKNHEQSKKHKEKVAELRRFFKEEDSEFEGLEVEEEAEVSGSDVQEGVFEVNNEDEDEVVDGFVSAEEDAESSDGEENGEGDLNEKFKECVQVDEGKERDGVGNDGKPNGVDEGKEKDDVFSDNKDGVGNKEESNGVEVEQPVVGSGEEASVPEELVEEKVIKKVERKSRRAKKDKGKASDGINDPSESSRAPSVSNDASDESDVDTRRRGKAGKKAADRKSKRDAKASSKGRKNKEKDADPVCEKCGLEFDSRNQLYKHLSDTGHATLKK